MPHYWWVLCVVSHAVAAGETPRPEGEYLEGRCCPPLVLSPLLHQCCRFGSIEVASHNKAELGPFFRVLPGLLF